MREPPDGPNLLDTARDVLLKDLLPHLPEAQRFHARMVANAMAIAAREARQDPAWQGEVAAQLSSLLDLHAEPEALLTRFAQAIRAGAFDPGSPGHAQAAAALRTLTRARCEVSAPRALG